MSEKDKNKEEPVEQKDISEKEEAQEEQDYQALFMRVSADYQNFKRRVEKEKSVWMHTAQASVIFAFLPIIDDIERAMSSCKEQHEDLEKESWFKGFDIIQKNLQKILADLQVEQIDCSGEFDPNYHEALMHVASDEHKSGEIVAVLSTGYLFKGQVLRHAKVSVAK